ncbi:alpha/beta hydrolase [Agrobacterium vitis]|uniref:alpha/beta hydrolase n=1 Tax=Agrobacterium vitis TaxID=373 RepID=UPI000872A8B0|nr:dienelactone hydrolase family protein [Agrobacterium vitis]MCE6073363.1 alpha/beta hydrolase [Agrobacterium vitis]MCM2452435.1 alpha/beta hydrolase [Agrobacterium vitis]MCM2469361.1 alpha/beta hydrolase [Agrobacterium vitis]MUO69236.1 alpha/beta hydrolase [Agrobacterium vitis]MUO83716.1 alpha/beta hydrolase [Agrobacterium vitis]
MPRCRLSNAFLLATTVLCLAFIACSPSQANDRQTATIKTTQGDIAIEAFERRASHKRPAIIILSGSKGFRSAAYDNLAQSLDKAGLDAYLVHAVSDADLTAIGHAKGAAGRIQYYTSHMAQWSAAVRDVLLFLKAQSPEDRKIGVLGISLGAQIAITATVNRQDANTLVLVDGGFPAGYSQSVRTIPPLLIVWGSEDRVFPVSMARALSEQAKPLGTEAEFSIFDGGSHDFFLKPETPLAKQAHERAARFLAEQLK